MKTLRSLCLPMLLMAVTAAWAGIGSDARTAPECSWRTPSTASTPTAANDACHPGKDPLVPWMHFHPEFGNADATQGNAPAPGRATELAHFITLPVRAMADYAETLLGFLARLCADAIFGVHGA